MNIWGLSRTYGVSIFIDYCTAPATQRKVEGEERDIQLINMNEASSCLAWGYWVPHSPRKESSAYQGLPPHPHTPHGRIIAVFSDLGQNRGRPPFRSLEVLQLNLDSNCDHVQIFGAVIGHLEAEIDFWIFHWKW
jgi:hypothetical protein